MATLGENFSRDKINNSDLPPLGQIKVKGETNDSKNGMKSALGAHYTSNGQLGPRSSSRGSILNSKSNLELGEDN